MINNYTKGAIMVENRNKPDSLQRLSRRLKRVAIVFMALTLIISVLFWLFINQLPSELLSRLPVKFDQSLSLSTRLLALLVTMIPVTLLLCGLKTLVNLFRSYESGKVFSQNNVKHFKTLGWVLIVWFFASVLYNALLSIVLTLNNPPGHRMLVVRFELLDLTSLLMGFVLIAIAKVMQLAYELNEDYAKVI